MSSSKNIDLLRDFAAGHVGIRPIFANCCPSNLLSGSTLPHLPPPLPCGNK